MAAFHCSLWFRFDGRPQPSLDVADRQSFQQQVRHDFEMMMMRRLHTARSCASIFSFLDAIGLPIKAALPKRWRRLFRSKLFYLFLHYYVFPFILNTAQYIPDAAKASLLLASITRHEPSLYRAQARSILVYIFHACFRATPSIGHTRQQHFSIFIAASCRRAIVEIGRHSTPDRRGSILQERASFLERQTVGRKAVASKDIDTVGKYCLYHKRFSHSDDTFTYYFSRWTIFTSYFDW